MVQIGADSYFTGDSSRIQLLQQRVHLFRHLGAADAIDNRLHFRDIARQLPMDQLLIKTDCPYLTPVPFRGKRNEPARVVETAKCLADLHHMKHDEIGKITSGNFTNLFGVRWQA